MKYKQVIANELESSLTLVENINKGLENRTISPVDMHEMNKRLIIHIKRAQQRLNLEYED